MFEELEAYFRKIQVGVEKLHVDIKNISSNRVKPDKDREIKPGQLTQKPSSTIQPMTRIRKNMQEIKKAQESPELTMIEDRLKDIFK